MSGLPRRRGVVRYHKIIHSGTLIRGGIIKRDTIFSLVNISLWLMGVFLLEGWLVLYSVTV